MTAFALALFVWGCGGADDPALDGSSGVDSAVDGGGAVDGAAIDGALDGDVADGDVVDGDVADSEVADASADGAPMDASSDAGADAGGADGSTDGGSADGGDTDGGSADGGGGDAGVDGGSGCTSDTACDDSVGCTVDACDTTTGICSNTPAAAACSDGTYCNGVEACVPGAVGADPSTGCLATAAPDCDDGRTCTTDACDEIADTCSNAPDVAVCNDGAFCNGAETCAPSAVGASPVTGCVAGSAPACSDGLACTVDSCDASLDTCLNVPNDASCDDGGYCNGDETCSPTSPGADARGCLAGAPVLCNDGYACTDDTCDEIADACTTTPIHTACDDRIFCNGSETCAPGPTSDAGGCIVGAPPTCADDGYTCSVEACDVAIDACDTAYDHGACGSGFVCAATGSDPSGCEMGMSCTGDPDCNDGNPCNGVEACVATICQPGTAPSCADALPCTVDTCEPASGCVHTVDHPRCDDGVVCNGAEICDAVVGCIDDTPPSCSDGIACTGDSCSAASDACVNAPNDLLCDDGAFCNGGETCTAGVGCGMGTPIGCNDGIACSVDGCNEASDACEHNYDSSMCTPGEVCTMSGCTPGASCTGPTEGICDDGLFCNGVETCSSSTSVPGVCQPGSAPDCDDATACTIDGCSNSLGGCTHVPRDLDGDGFGDDACGGFDCDDGDPTINPLATDVCDGVDNDCDGEIDGGLAPTGGLCAVGSDCCSGSCGSGICTEPPGVCALILDTCTGDSDCCTGLCSASVDGVRRCQVPGGCGVAGTACVTAADCCSTGCVGGVCSDTTTCRLVGTSCTTDAQCCSNDCTGGACVSAGPSCQVDGETCSSHGNCCSGLCFPTSTGGRCSGHDTCRAEGEICTSGSDCCTGGCDPTTGRCQFIGSCATSGEPCTSVRSCCSALCVDAGSGTGICEFLPGCRPFGEVCTTGSQCCSSICGAPEGPAMLRRCVNPPGCVHAGEICAQGGSNNCCVLRSRGCIPTGLGVSRCNDQEMCIPLAGECDFNEQCCDGRLCVLDPSGVRRCSDSCVPTSGACLSNTDCCVGRCLAGSCDDTPIGCIPVGGSGCVFPSDCCSGNCLVGVCASIGD